MAPGTPLIVRKWTLLLADVVLVLIALELSPLIRLGQHLDVHLRPSLLALLTYPATLYVFDLYNIGRTFRWRDLALRTGLAVSTAGFFISAVFYILPQLQYGRGIVVIQMTLVWLFLTGGRWVAFVIFSKRVGQEPVLVLGAGKSGTALYQVLEDNPSPYRIAGFLDDDPAKQGKVIGSPSVVGATDRLMEIAAKQGIKTVILAITHDKSSSLIRLMLEARFKGITVLEMATVYESLTGRIPISHIKAEWLLFSEGFYLVSKGYVQRVKRLIDFLLSAALLILSLPLLAGAALAVRLDSPGPVLFRQERIGHGERTFTLIKLRSMHQGAESNGAAWAGKDDPRVTRVGRCIRFFRLDEFPQLWNVLKGEMSLIGPRPERPEFIRELEAHIPYYAHRHSVRPGITGWAQVNYPYGDSVEAALNKLEYEMYYIKNMSLFLDFKILLRTLGVVVLGQGSR